MYADPLVLLGVWNEPPLSAWCWFDDAAIERLYQLTGVRVRVFTYVQDELHYQCVFEREIHILRDLFEQHKTDEEKVTYVSEIFDDFYARVRGLEQYLDVVKQHDISSYSDAELVAAIRQFSRLWTSVTMHVWYAVFFDILYPREHEYPTVKAVAAKARDYAGRLHVRSDVVTGRVYDAVARRLSMDTRQVCYLFPDEIIDAVLNRTSYHDHARARREFCVTTSIRGGYCIYSGEQARVLYDRYQPPSVGSTALQVLSGTPAHPGMTSGVVRVVRRNSDFELFDEGEILVVLQTMIHYVPIMKKARAILTEFGGLTSHAAVVSRELNIPCIVGISNLLASVKDGDRVEVDAEKGVVSLVNA